VEAAAAPPQKLDVGKVINETFSIYGQNAFVVLASSIVVFVVVGVVSGLLQTDGGVLLQILAAVIRVAGFAFYTGFVVRLVEDVRDGRRDQTIGGLMSSATPAIVSLVVFGILFGIGVGIGLVLIIVPGLILLTFWSVGAPAIVVERAGPIKAFGRSWRLVRGDAWSVFGALLVMLLFIIVFGVVLAVIATPIGNGAIIVANVISNIITAPLFAIAVSVMFFDLGGGRAAEPA
jgi:hypothetical protein